MPAHYRMYRNTMSELASLLREADDLKQDQIAAVQEVIDFYRDSLPSITDFGFFADSCRRAFADIEHEIAMARYGEESDEAYAVFIEGQMRLGYRFAPGAIAQLRYW